MRPYFEQNGITLYLGNSLEVIPQLRDIDLVVTDPPYGETSLSWDKSAVRGWLDLVEEIGVESVWIFGSLRMYLSMAAAGEFSRWKQAQDLVWEKQAGAGVSNDRFRRVHEHMLHLYRGKWADVYKNPQKTAAAKATVIPNSGAPGHLNSFGPRIKYDNGGMILVRSVIRERNCHGYAEHPTQKPTALLKLLLRYSLKPTGIALDPFAGSGSSLVAAQELGYRAVGIEQDEKNCEIAARRLCGLGKRRAA